MRDSQECKEQNKRDVPLGVLLDSVGEGLELYILRTMNEHGIPASLMDYVLTSATMKVKEMKYREYARVAITDGGENING